jgi:hypothetical protein
MTALRSAYRQTSTTTGDFSFLSLDAVDTVDAGNDGGRGGSTLGRAGAATPAKIGIAQVHLLLRRDSELQQPWMAPWQRPCRWFRQRQTELEDKLCGTSNWAFGLYFLFPVPQPKTPKTAHQPTTHIRKESAASHRHCTSRRSSAWRDPRSCGAAAPGSARRREAAPGSARRRSPGTVQPAAPSNAHQRASSSARRQLRPPGRAWWRKLMGEGDCTRRYWGLLGERKLWGNILQLSKMLIAQ